MRWKLLKYHQSCVKKTQSVKSGGRKESVELLCTWNMASRDDGGFHGLASIWSLQIIKCPFLLCVSISSCFTDGLNGSFSPTFACFRVQTRFVRNRPNSNADYSVYAALQRRAGGLLRCMCRRGRLWRQCVWERAGNHNLDQSSRQSGRWEMTAGGIRPLVMNEKGSEL